VDQQVQRADLDSLKSNPTFQDHPYIDNIRTILYSLDMAQMNVSIPDKLKNWVESRVADGSYASSSDYMRDLVRRDQRAEEARMRLQAEIDKGLASPESDRTIADITAEGRAKIG
jgi:antitoxin ParD1/3/4